MFAIYLFIVQYSCSVVASFNFIIDEEMVEKGHSVLFLARNGNCGGN